MLKEPKFSSDQDYVSRLGDMDFWWPYLSTILVRYGLLAGRHEPQPGVGGTFPTFLCGEYVVKLFGGWHSWAQSFATERAAHRLLETGGVSAPRWIADGRLFPGRDAEWPFLITTLMSGSSWHDTRLMPDERLSLAVELGRQMRVVHALQPRGISSHEDCPTLDIVRAAERSSLPAHLVVQIDDYLVRLRPFDRVFVHGDLTPRHVFVAGGRLSGIIDWGDALVTDRHYELAKLHLSLFAGEKAPLKAFLSASDWPMTETFAHQALGLAFHRQAHGLLQHHSMDVFHIVAERHALQDVRTLDQLANELFAI